MHTYARIFAAVASATLTIANAPMSEAATHCAKLAQDVCASTPACKWTPERKAGDVNARTGQPFKRDMKATCRFDVSAASALIAPAKK